MSEGDWPCMICGEGRPYEAISVSHRPIERMEDKFPDARFNVRYCNDNPICIAKAHETGPWRGPYVG